MKIETPFIAMVLAALFFTGLFGLVSFFSTTYDVPLSTSSFGSQGNSKSLQNAFMKINQSKTDMDEATKDIMDTTLGESNDVFEFLRMTWVIGKQTFSNMSTLKDMVMAASIILGLPMEVVATLLTILLLVFVIAILMMIIGRNS